MSPSWNYSWRWAGIVIFGGGAWTAAAAGGLAAQQGKEATAKAESKPGTAQVSLQILTELSIAELAISVEPFTQWAKPVIQRLEQRLAHPEKRRLVVVQVTLRRTGDSEVKVSGRPALEPGETAAVLELVDTSKAPHSKLVDFSFRFVVQVNGGSPDKKGEPVPRLDTPDERRLQDFQKAMTADQLGLLKQWARDQAIPILAAFASRAEPKYVGVRNLGAALQRLDSLQPIATDKLTERNPDYWRAFVEMAPGIPLIPTIRVAVLTADGELEKARRWAELASLFDNGKNGASWVLGNLRTMIRLYEQGLGARITPGIALHDKKQYGEALAIYKAVLKDAPKSASAHYEQFQTQRALALADGKTMDQANAGWPEVKAKIDACDPLYPHLALASSGRELYELFLRMKASELFREKTRDAQSKDLIQYADLALDLGQYGLAASIYWYATAAIDRKFYDNREIVEYFLFCMEKLGATQLKENFRGDHAASFLRIAEERRKLMEASPAYDKFLRDKEPKTP